VADLYQRLTNYGRITHESAREDETTPRRQNLGHGSLRRWPGPISPLRPSKARYCLQQVAVILETGPMNVGMVHPRNTDATQLYRCISLGPGNKVLIV
jgi:hypothetical protein